MGRCVIQLDGKFMEWTSVSDGPASLLLTEEQFRRYWREEYGRARWHELAEILLTVKKNGTTARGYTVDKIIKNNRAGKNDNPLTKQQLIDCYSITDPEDFAVWCENRDKFAEDQYKEWEEIFAKREKES
jgi:hypothetical protein